MYMKQLRFMYAFLTAVLVGVMSSCSGRGDILDTIPADVNMVATINVDKFCAAAGITLKDDGAAEIVAPMKAVADMIVGDVPAKIAALKAKGIVDVDNVVLAVDADRTVYVTCGISGVNELKEALSNDASWSQSGGYQTMRHDDMTLLAKGTQLWAVMNSRDAVKSVESMLKRAGEMSVSKLDGIVQALGRDNIANVAVGSGMVTFTTDKKSNTEIPVQDKEWNVASLKEGADNSLVVDWEMMQSTGRTVKPKGLQNINPALLAYVPENFNVALAAGITPEFDWEPLRRLAMVAGGFQTAAFMSVVNPYLESIDGTVLMAAAPSSPELIAGGDVTDWDFIVLAHMPQSRITGLMNIIRNMLSTAGMPAATTPEGWLAVPQYGKTMYIGNIDGYLGISTIGFDNTRNNPLAPTFVNKEFAASFSLTPYSAYFPGAAEDMGVELTASMAEGKGTAKLKVEGSQYPVLVFLFTAAK